MGETVRFSLHLCCQEMQSELEERLADKRIETFSEEKTWEVGKKPGEMPKFLLHFP